MSSARKASSTPVIGLATPVAGRLGTTSGARVGAGSGSSNTHSTKAAVTTSDSSPAMAHVPGPLRSLQVAASVPRRRPTAPSSSAPVRPPPMAASVSATSMPASRTHTSDNNKP